MKPKPKSLWLSFAAVLSAVYLAFAESPRFQGQDSSSSFPEVTDAQVLADELSHERQIQDPKSSLRQVSLSQPSLHQVTSSEVDSRAKSHQTERSHFRPEPFNEGNKPLSKHKIRQAGDNTSYTLAAKHGAFHPVRTVHPVRKPTHRAAQQTALHPSQHTTVKHRQVRHHGRVEALKQGSHVQTTQRSHPVAAKRSHARTARHTPSHAIHRPPGAAYHSVSSRGVGLVLRPEAVTAFETVQHEPEMQAERAAIGQFTVTAYALTAQSTGKRPGQPGFGITASGSHAHVGRTVAVDPSVIPIGSLIYIDLPGIGWRLAEDTGGAIRGRHIDLLLPSDGAAIKFGIKHGVRVYAMSR